MTEEDQVKEDKNSEKNNAADGCWQKFVIAILS